MTVPPAIEQPLYELSPRLRRIRVVRGAARSVLLALLMVYAVALFDIISPLPGWARAISFAAWITTVGVLVWRWVLVPCRSEISLPEIARELEKRLPELGERLRGILERDRPNITPAAHALLVEDMSRRLKSVHFPQTISYIPAMTLALAGLVALLSTAAVVACHPSAAHQLRRVALPWSRTCGLTAYYVHVVSPPTVVPRGEPVTIAAYPKRYNTNERTYVSHADATLIVRDCVSSVETQYMMQAGIGGEFHVTLPGASSDFDFCVQLGEVRSEWWPVVVVDAVELTEATRIVVSPPPYVGLPPQTNGFADVTVPQYSLIEFEGKFDRPVAFANLEWQPANAAASENLRLIWQPDRCGVQTSLRVSHNGRIRLVVATEERGQKLFREKAIAVRVIPDEPPRFEQLSGLVRRLRTAKPEDILKIEFTATDDRGVAAAALEYQIDTRDNPITILPLALTSRGNGGSAGAVEFPLAGRVREGDVLRLRLRVFDNRTVEGLALVPQEAVYPPVGWSELRIHPHAESLALQDVIAQRDDIQDRLALATAELTAAASEIDIVHRESTGSALLEVHHQTRLQNARMHIQTARHALHEAAAEAQLAPPLRQFATECQEVAHELFHRAAVALLQAETDQPTIRHEALNQARACLNPSIRRTRELQETNATIAQHRFDRLQLLALASELAASATLSPKAARVEIHRQLAAQLDTIIARSPSLRQAVETAKNAEFQQWLCNIRKQGEFLQQWNQQAEELYTLTRQERITDIVRQQEVLVQQAVKVLRDVETACRLVGVTLPSPHELRRTAELAATGKTVEALAELEKHTQMLERVAQTFERWSLERRDPKEAAHQLVRWQDDLLTRFRTATKDVAYIGLQEEEKARFQLEQHAILEAVRSLEGPKEAAFGPAHEQAVRHTTAALRSLAGNGATAEAAMTAATTALRTLATSTPSLAERLTLSLRTVDSLRLQWEATSNTVELTLKKIDRLTPETLAKHWAPIADKQGKLVSLAESLDLPGLQSRQARLIRAMKTALADLHTAASLDVPASQAWVRRELERLKWVLEGYSSPDDRAEEAAQKLLQLAASAAVSRDSGDSPPERLAPVLQDVLRQLNSLVAPEAPALWQEARNLVQRAEQATREGSPERVQVALEAAAEATRQLADRLNGRETGLERIQRLAYNRRSAAEKPKERLLSDDMIRQLSREADELLHTRVGWAGGPLKKRALDLYSKLRTKSDLDRFGTDHKALIAVLDELAALMADNADLATLEPRPPVRAALVAERILPSSELAASLRTLIELYRPLHTYIANLTHQLHTRFRPGLWPASRRCSLLQVIHIQELIEEIGQLITVGEAIGLLNGADAATQQRLMDAIAQLREAEKRLRTARSRHLAGVLSEAIQLRTDATTRLLAVGESVAPSMLSVTPSVTGEHILIALRAIRQPEEAAIRRAAAALEHAAQSLGR